MAPTRVNSYHPHLPPEIKPPKRRRGKSQENADQRAWRDALNLLRLGKFWRVKTTGTYDPVRKIFRRDKTADTGIPDICGYLTGGRAVFIECKFVEGVEKKKNLLFKAKTTVEQRDFLLAAHRSGCIAGIAFTLDDAIAIARDDSVKYHRHPRTYQFMPEDWQKSYAEKYMEIKKALARQNQDPLARDIFSHTPKD